MKNRISIVGMGYVGLCTAVMLAKKGYKIITSEINLKKVELINKGIPPFYEPDLEECLRKVVENSSLKCTTNLREIILNTNITFITVGTPSKSDRSIDLQYIEDAAYKIGEALRDKDTYHLIVVRSTVIPGTTEKMIKPIIERTSSKKCGKDFGLCVNPEFLREGSALHDILYPDRIIIGEYDGKSGEVLEGLYRDFHGDDMPLLLRTNLTNGEMIKYANNSFLATKISFINQIANVCERIPGANVTIVAKALGLDRRIEPSFLNAGLGYGGSCFPKDVKAFISYSKELGCDPILLQAVEEVNDCQSYWAVELARNFLGDLNGKRIAILGLAFKPDTDDVREAVSIKVINKLLNEGANVIAYDPAATENAREIFKERIVYAPSIAECIKNAECCVIVTEWDEFKNIQPEDFIQYMKTPVILDGRRIYDPNQFSQDVKFAAVGLGSKSIRN